MKKFLKQEEVNVKNSPTKKKDSDSPPMIDKAVINWNQDYMDGKSKDEQYKGPEGFSNPIISGALSGIVTMLKFAGTIPNRLNDSNDVNSQSVPSSPTISKSAHEAAIKQMTELEEKVIVLTSKAVEMPQEKAEMLNAATNHINTLEAELSVTKKV